MNKNNERKNGIEFKNFYASLQKLLFYFTKQETIKKEETIFNIIKSVKEQLKLSAECINFFYNEGKNLALNKMMNLFFFFEHLCFENLCANLKPEYLLPISKETETKIKQKLIKVKNSKDTISVKELASATRRFISRYLVGKQEFNDVGEKRKLVYELCRKELWEEKIGNLDNLFELIEEKIKEFDLIVGQSYEFYNLIGEEDRKAFNFIH